MKHEANQDRTRPRPFWRARGPVSNRQWPSPARAPILSILGRVLAVVGLSVVFTGATLVAAALTAGFRPVVITGGSMGQQAPLGSVVIAAPSPSVAVGDLLVMQRDARPTVIHRVIEIEHHRGTSFAITKGEANAKPDPAPYALGRSELTGRLVIPGLGSTLLRLTDPVVATIGFGLGVGIPAAWLLRRIWQRGSRRPGARRDGDRKPRPRDRRGRRLLAATIVVAGWAVGGTAGAIYTSNGAVPANVINTPACFDAQLGSVQSGQAISSTDGVQTVAITAVDPARSFLITSVRSASNEPADAMVQAHLRDATTVELTRRTDGGPATVVVEWSVVEYGCGVSVQRGVVSGNGAGQLDIAVTSVDTAAAFALLSSVGATTDTDFDGSALAIAELTSQTNLRLRTLAPATLPAGSGYAWQLVSFDDPTDVAVQTVSTNLAASAGTTLPIAAVDPDTTLILATAATGSSGADIAERMVRVHLASSTSVAVDRDGGGDPIEVHVQVVELRDGSTVRHGTIDFAAAQTARTVTVDHLDPARTTALSTVQVPGSQSGGLTAMAADDIVGEGSAAFTVVDDQTIGVTRNAASTTASFGWQAVEWGGPSWWDTDYTFRQRIDVTSGVAAAPGGYSVPVVVDHAALVTAGLARADAQDLRVLRWNGSSWSELDRVLADGGSWNASDSTFWFRTSDPVAAASTDSYWLYYGNSGIPPPPLEDPENVWLLTEDFESGTLGDFEDRTAGTAWYGADPWTRRIPLTITSGTVSADLDDFTVLVQLTSADLAANAKPDGGDIRFTASDGATALAHEVERWDSGTGALTAWVRVPSLATASNTTLYLYYGAADSPTKSDRRAAWPSSALGVWHLSRDPSGPGPQLDDSTVYNRDGVSAGTMATADLVTGVAGDGIDLDGTDDRFDLGRWEPAGHRELTVSGWINLDSAVGEGRVLTKASGAANRVLALGHNGTAARVRLSVGGATVEVSGGTLSVGTWHHLAAVWDGTALQLFVDGVRVGSGPAYGIVDSDPTMAVTIGDLGSGGGAIDGRIDELRLESEARSLPWITAAEDNQRNPGTFITAGSVETGSWFHQGAWSYRKPVTVDAALVDATIADHPLLIQITDTELGAAAQIGGADIVFTAADGTTRLDHEIESWNAGTGALTAWVRVPSLSDTTDTELFVYYGNGTAIDQQDPEAVFGADADLVAHLNP